MSENKNMKRQSFAPGALTAPLPPVLVTVGDMDEANIITIAWTGILATIPPKTYISVRPSRHSYGMLKENENIHILLNTSCTDAKTEHGEIRSVTGWQSTTYTEALPCLYMAYCELIG